MSLASEHVLSTPLVTLQRTSRGAFVLTMCAFPENRFTRALIRDIDRALDAVEASEGPAALVIASSIPKFFSNGHDVGAITGDADEAASFVKKFYALLARIMSLGVITVAAVSGHAFAGGLLLALAADFRVMRADRGYACMNEIDMVAASAVSGVQVKPGTIKNADAMMMAALRAKVPQPLLSRMMLTGKRYGGEEAARVGLVDSCAQRDRVLPEAIDLAETLAAKGAPPNRGVVSTLKREMYARSLKSIASSL